MSCAKCNYITCVCGIRKKHPDPTCKFRVSATCAVPVECDHGYDVCPKCDPCTCGEVRKGPVRVVAEGPLKGNRGTVTGFVEQGGRKLCMVEWLRGGHAFMAAEDLRQEVKKGG